jgi:hypothetical protein
MPIKHPIEHKLTQLQGWWQGRMQQQHVLTYKLMPFWVTERLERANARACGASAGASLAPPGMSGQAAPLPVCYPLGLLEPLFIHEAGLVL